MDLTFTPNGWGGNRLDVHNIDGFIGWAGAAGAMFQWNDERQIAFAYNTVQPYLRVDKPRAVRLLKVIMKCIEEKERGSTQEGN